MDRKKSSNKKITAIVPTYNEAKRIEQVIEVLVTYPNFEEIIVVDDGSTDHTEKIIKKYPVNYIKNKINQGKGYAMNVGVNKTDNDIIFFVDADVVGLTHDTINQITKPVINEEVDMFIGMRNRKIYYLHNIMIFVPLLGGERAITKKLWQMMPSFYKHRFRIEAGLNFFAQYYGRGFKYKIFQGLSQVIKEKKYGFFQGLKQRIGMIINVATAQFKLQFVDIPKSIKNKRLLAFLSLQNLLGIILGIIILTAVYFGPNNLVLKFFSEELREDPNAPFVNYLLYLTNVTAVGIFALIGSFILIINSFTFLLTFKKLSFFFLGISNKIKSRY